MKFTKTNIVEVLIKNIKCKEEKIIELNCFLVSKLLKNSDFANIFVFLQGNFVLTNQLQNFASLSSSTVYSIVTSLQTLFKFSERETDHLTDHCVGNLLEISSQSQSSELVSSSLNLLTAFALNNELSLFIRNNFLQLIFEKLIENTVNRAKQNKNQHFLNNQLLLARIIRMLHSHEVNKAAINDYIPAPLMDNFEQIGNFNKNLEDYFEFADLLSDLKEDVLHKMLEKGSTPLSQNCKIGEYTILEMIGKGGYGTVYKVKLRDKMFAMKEVELTGDALNRSKVESGYREVTVWKDLRHPNIVRYYSSFVEDGRIYIIMELIEGPTLSQMVESYRNKNEEMTEDHILKIATDLVSALYYLHHDKHILFRDLNTSNVMVERGFSAKLIDFGLAKQINCDLSQSTLDTPGHIMYLAPEIHRNEEQTEKSDIFSFGCILYEMVTLRRAFEAEGLLRIINKINNVEYDKKLLVGKSKVVV